MVSPVIHDMYQVVGITDFTSNDKLNDEAEFLNQSATPFSHDILVECTLWDEYSKMNLELGSYVHLQNVRSKLNRWGRLEYSIAGGSKGKKNAVTYGNEALDGMINLRKRESEYYSQCSQATRQALINFTDEK